MDIYTTYLSRWSLRGKSILLLVFLATTCSAQPADVDIGGLPIGKRGVYGIEPAMQRVTVLSRLKEKIPRATAFCANTRCNGSHFFVEQAGGASLAFSFKGETLVKLRAMFPDRLTTKEHEAMITQLSNLFGKPRKEGYGFWDAGDISIVLLPSSITFAIEAGEADQRSEATVRLRVGDIE